MVATRVFVALAVLAGVLQHGEAAPFEPTVCPTNWEAFRSRCWYYSSPNDRDSNGGTWKPWAQANTFCKSMGGTLLSVHNKAEADKALSICTQNYGGWSGRGVCWHGLYQVQGQSNKEFAWVDGTDYYLTDEPNPADRTLVFDNWGRGEPNNVGSGGEDCMHNWDRTNQPSGSWNDEPCTNVYPFLCGQEALCPKGAYRSRAFDSRRKTNGQFDQSAQCELCPAGYYRKEVGGVGIDSCVACPPGTMGAAGERNVCQTACPAGYYCPEGTSSTAGVDTPRGRKSCPVGFYNDVTGIGDASECKECSPGFYCSGNGETRPDPPGQKCKAGQCGFAAQSDEVCNSRCPPGYKCPTGSACPSALVNGQTPSNVAQPCGGASVYCPEGSITASAVDDGHYSVGPTQQTRSSQELCEPGYFCKGGLRQTCPGGTFVADPGMTDSVDCKKCDAGYVCPEGEPNSSPRTLNCYDEDFFALLSPEFDAHIGKRESVYCPTGSAKPHKVSSGFYSTPTSNAYRINRRGQNECNTAQVCQDGVRTNLLSWGAGGCSNNNDEIVVLEMTPAGNVVPYNAQINTRVTASDYDVRYRMKSFEFFDNTATECAPNSPATNQDIFAFDSPQLRLTRDDLNYEVCLPNLDIQYKAVVQAQAYKDNALMATIGCTVTIVVDDDNDDPLFIHYDKGTGASEEQRVYHRQIEEKVDKNVPVAFCDSAGAPYSCPQDSQAAERVAELRVVDEDDAAILRYSIVSGNDGQDATPSKRPFKIDPCTGLVSARASKQISFAQQQEYRYIVKVEDDGNGGRWPIKEHTATLVIHVIDRNDAPVLEDDPGTITIRENMPAGTATNIMVQATDEDNDALTFQIAQNDGDAFKIVNNVLQTTLVGAQTINFESSKKEYYIEIEVQDGRQGYSSGIFLVTVEDTNDAPVFTGRTAFYVRENAPETAVCDTPTGLCDTGAPVQTTDEDSSAAGDVDKTIYSLDHPHFQIDASTGVISTKAGAAGSLDFEDTSTDLPTGTGRGYILQVTATSPGIPTDDTDRSTTAQITVYVVDVNEDPVITTTASFSVLETWPVGYVIPDFVEATDPDNADTALLLNKPPPTQTLAFSGRNEFFAVETDPNTGKGQIKVIKKLDFETLATNPVELEVLVEDNGGPERGRATRTMLIAVEDANERPSFPSPSFLFSTPENQVYTGPVLTATDPDADGLTYTVRGGNGVALFELNTVGSSFQITQRSVLLGTTTPVQLNYELSSKEWTLNLRVEDNGPSAMIAAECSVTDPNSCGEGAICQLDRCYEKCYDTTARDARDINHDKLFRCDYNGEAVEASINGVATPLHKEVAEALYVIDITNVNDAPALDSCPLTLLIASNRAGSDQTLTTPGFLTSKTKDEDALNNDGQFILPYTFSLAGAPAFLSIDPTDLNIIYTTGVAPLDEDQYNLELVITDEEPKESRCPVIVNVVESNEPPVLENVVTEPVPENSAQDSTSYVVLPKLNVIDADDPAIEKHTFTTSFNPYLDVDFDTGQITLGTARLDYEALKATNFRFELIVRVTDRLGAEDVAVISVPVTDVNEAPTFSFIPKQTVREDSAANAIVIDKLLDVYASDPDTETNTPANKQITFTRTGCEPAATCPVAVDSATGQVRLTRAVNFEEADNSWDVTVTATDGGGLSSEATFTVEVGDVNEAPKFQSSNNVVKVNEGDLDQNANLFSMLEVVADEDESDTPASLKYTIISGDSNLFRIEDGVLKGNNFVLDFETSRSYELEIEAEDAGGLTDSAIVVVEVQNLNDVRITGVAVQGASALTCSGGTKVRLTGRNLGMTDAALAGDTTFTVTYTSDITGVEYTCSGAEQVTAGDNSVIECTTTAGVGAGFTWQATVAVSGLITGDQSPVFQTPSLAYGAPVLSSVSGASALPTRGGSPVKLSGTCIGTPSDFPGGLSAFAASTFVRYCNADNTCYRPSCTISQDNDNELICTSSPGIGTELRWVASILGVSSLPTTSGDYAPPTVTGASFNVFPSTGTFSTALVISGTNFADAGAVPGRAFAYFQSAHDATVERFYELQGCVVSKAFEEVTCASIVSGMGKDMPLVVEFGGQESDRATNPVLVSYQRPIITSFSGEGVQGASTTGGQQVIVRGTGFGPSCGKPASPSAVGGTGDEGIVCDILKTTYSRGSKRASNPSETLVYEPRCAVVSSTQMACVTAPGTGANHRWSFDLGGHLLSPDTLRTSYEVPTVGAYLGGGSRDARTRGDEDVIVLGSNFGPADGARVYAYYGPEENPTEFGPQDCVVSLDNEKVTCKTLPGAGDELKWTIYVDEQESRAEVTDYGDPVVTTITGLDGTDVSDLSNDGGQRVLLSGQNFGPPSALNYLESVHYGPAGNPRAYAPLCYVDSHEEIICITSPGIGAGMRWRVQVKGQESLLSPTGADYTPPTIFAPAKLGGPTDGGYKLRIEGEGLAVCDPEARLVILFGDNDELDFANFYDADFSTTVPVDLTDPASCPLSPRGNAKSFDFFVPEMYDVAYKTIGIRLESKLFDDVFLSNTFEWVYDAPVLESVYAEPVGGVSDPSNPDPVGCSGEFRVTLRGRNFCRSPECCQVNLDGSFTSYVTEEHTHRIISLCTSNLGPVYIKCGDRSTDVFDLNAESPFIFQTTTSRGQPLTEIDFPTRATGSDEIYIWGLYFGEREPRVAVGPWNATVTEHRSLSCASPEIPPHNFGRLETLDVQCFKTTIIVPSGQSRQNGIVVFASLGDQSSLANQPYEMVNFKAPAITALEGTFPAPTVGGGVLTIKGTDLGLSQEVQILELIDNGLFGSQWVQVGYANCSDTDHEELVCEMPPGEGADLAVYVKVGNQDTGEQNGDFKFSYIAPTVTEVENTGTGTTEGGELIILRGANFGRPWSKTCPSFLARSCTPSVPVVDLGTLSCVIESNTQTEIACRTPEGEGRGLAIVVNVHGQEANTGAVFDFAPPEIDFFTPQEASTDGMGENNTREVLTIVGRNFGVDELTVTFEIEGSAEGPMVVGERSKADGVNDFDDILSMVTNHTMITMLVPEYRGKDITVRVNVAGQVVEAADLFSYKEPTVSNIVTVDEDGNEVEWGSGSTEIVDDFFFSDGESDEDGASRLLQDSGDSPQFTAPTRPLCQRSVKSRGYSWKTVVHDIFEGNTFARTVLLYEGEMCDDSSLLLQADIDGRFKDVRGEGAVELSCTQTYSQIVTRVAITPQTVAGLRLLASPTCCASDWELAVSKDVTQCIAQSGCPQLTTVPAVVQAGTRYGVYVLSGRTKLYMSETEGSLEALGKANAFRLPDQPTAELVSKGTLNSPTAGTSGCFLWEPYRDYLQRRREAFQLTGSALDVYRRCLRKALMTLDGRNFGNSMFNASREIRVFFVGEGEGDSTTQFEAATTSSKGDHPEVCLPEEGCKHEHTQITFQIPPGYGRNLRMRIQIGNQFADAKNLTTDMPIRFHYEPPSVDYANPGSIFRSYAFQDAVGGETLELLGENFGGVLSPASVLLNGRECVNATWRSGDEDDEGKPFLSCLSERDVTGPKSLFVCVAGQGTFLSAVTTDAVLLVEADRVRRELGDTDEASQRVDELYANAGSVVNSRCKSSYDAFGNVLGRMGGIRELCVECPDGSICNEPEAPFTPPNALPGFYRIDVPTYDEDGVLTERAERRCPAERWDKSLVDAYPDILIGDTCSDYVACEPLEACDGANQCSEEYQYAFVRCSEKRAEQGFNNTCRVTFDPFTSTYKGVQTDCNPTPEKACDPDRPWECSTCEVVFEDGDVRGECQCAMPQRCALCSIYTHYRLNNRCRVCPDNPALVIAMFVLLIIVFIAGGWYLNKKRINLALMAIGVDYFQVLAIFTSVNIVWPESLQRLFQLLSFFNFNIDIAAPECLVPTLEFETKWWLMEAMPMAVLALLVIVHLVYSAYKLVRFKDRAKLTSHVSRMVAIFLVCFYFLYLNVTKKSLDIFNCNPLPVDDGYLYTAFSSLQCDGGGLCRCGEGIQQRLVPLAAVFLIIYSFGFPAVVYLLIKKNRDVIIEDQYLRAHDIGDTRETNPRAYDIRKRYAALYQHYKPERTYWIFYIILRKFLIASAALLFRGNPTFQLSVVLLVLFWAFVIHLMTRPYLSTGEKPIVLKELDAKAERGLDLEEFQPFLALQKKIQDSVKIAKETDRKKKTRFANKDMWKEDDKASKYARRKARQRRAGELFFDYNTVEAVLLASSILVCLGGIMLDSGRFETRSDIEYQRDSITYLLILIIVFTFTYYILVLLVEIFPTITTYGATRCLQILQRRKPEDHEITDLDGDLQYDENPMFRTAEGDNGKSKLKAALAANQADLDRMAEQNDELRKELQRQKQNDQVNNDDFDIFGVPSPMFAKKKEFNPMRATDKIKKTLMRGKKQKGSNNDDDDDEVDADP